MPHSPPPKTNQNLRAHPYTHQTTPCPTAPPKRIQKICEPSPLYSKNPYSWIIWGKQKGSSAGQMTLSLNSPITLPAKRQDSGSPMQTTRFKLCKGSPVSRRSSTIVGVATWPNETMKCFLHRHPCCHYLISVEDCCEMNLETDADYQGRTSLPLNCVTMNRSKFPMTFYCPQESALLFFSNQCGMNF